MNRILIVMIASQSRYLQAMHFLDLLCLLHGIHNREGLTMTKKHIAVIGNMGAGKTTFINLLVTHFVYPPVVYLEQPSDYPFVELSFREPYRWSMTNQIHFLLVKLQQQMNHGDSIVIQEMDLHAAHFLWSPVLRELGHVTNDEAELIQQVFAVFSHTVSMSKPDVYIYIP